MLLRAARGEGTEPLRDHRPRHRRRRLSRARRPASCWSSARRAPTSSARARGRSAPRARRSPSTSQPVGDAAASRPRAWEWVRLEDQQADERPPGGGRPARARVRRAGSYTVRCATRTATWWPAYPHWVSGGRRRARRPAASRWCPSQDTGAPGETAEVLITFRGARRGGAAHARARPRGTDGPAAQRHGLGARQAPGADAVAGARCRCAPTSRRTSRSRWPT